MPLGIILPRRERLDKYSAGNSPRFQRIIVLLVLDGEPIRLLKSPRSLGMYFLINNCPDLYNR